MHSSLRNFSALVVVGLVTYVGRYLAGSVWYHHVLLGGPVNFMNVSMLRFWSLSAVFELMIFGVAGALMAFAVKSSVPALWAALLGIGFGVRAFIRLPWSHDGSYSAFPGFFGFLCLFFFPLHQQSLGLPRLMHLESGHLNETVV